MLILVACSSASTPGTAGSTSPAGDPNTDKLAQILDRGTLVGTFEPEYPPQSMAVEEAARPADTKCSEDQLTAAEVTGFDNETLKVVAAGLGVEACFARPKYSLITAGNWGDRFDITYASGSINEDRMERLWMTQPYYAVPNFYFVAEDSPYQEPADLDGKEIGACASCSHELYLRGELVIPGIEIVPTVQEPQVVTYETEAPGLEAVGAGTIDAFLCAEPVGQAQIDEGLALRQLDGIAFTYYPSGFVDKSSGLDPAAFVARVDEIIQAAHADGTLLAMSKEWFGTDYTSAAAEYDVDSLGQEVT
jgi:ABC-type amino acid transport substrate-binding protein